MAEADDPEPASRAPVVPPAPEGPTEAVPVPQRGGTVRMHADDVPAAKAARARKTSSSLPPGGRASRLSVMRTSLSQVRTSLANLRESVLSRLPPLPKSVAAMGAPIAVLVVVGVFGIFLVLWLALTGRLPDIAARLTGASTNDEQSLLPPPPDLVELGEAEWTGPSATPGRANVGVGVLSVPRTFTAMKDGQFDLVVHFHGNTELSVESYEVALLDTVVLVFNLGNGSGVYEERFSNPDALNNILERVPAVLQKRGLENARVRRLALVGWSAGYGAIIRALEHPAHADRVDAVILLDGLHSSYRPGTHDIEPANILSTEAFARRAMKGEKLLVITHSNIKPMGYLGVRETVDFLLGRLELSRTEVSLQTEIPALRAAKGVLPQADLRPLELRTEVRSGGLVVRGFGGDQAAHHISHLMQMSQIALPELAKRWQPEDAP